jgi:putative tryptophan/tyrosine transport system substrate-binding protein
MRRRNFLGLVGGAAAWPLTARAQQPALPVIGLISAGSRDAYADLLVAFRQGLKEAGYVEGQTAAIESRWADGQLDRLPGLVTDLVQRRVAVIVTTGGSSSRAAKDMSQTVPVVFLSQSDPISAGLVTSFNRPGGNATGLALLTGPLVAKRLETILQLAPAGAPVGYLMNPQSVGEAGDYLAEVQAAAQAIGQRLVVVNASSPWPRLLPRLLTSGLAARRQHRSLSLWATQSNHRAGGTPWPSHDLRSA